MLTSSQSLVVPRQLSVSFVHCSASPTKEDTRRTVQGCWRRLLWLQRWRWWSSGSIRTRGRKGRYVTNPWFLNTCDQNLVNYCAHWTSYRNIVIKAYRYVVRIKKILHQTCDLYCKSDRISSMHTHSLLSLRVIKFWLKILLTYSTLSEHKPPIQTSFGLVMFNFNPKRQEWIRLGLPVIDILGLIFSLCHLWSSPFQC